MTPARTSPPTGAPRLGLRERKKIKTRTAIRDATYALIQEQGYDATTVEQIADRAEVSPSTVFRYFPTKEDIVLTDEYDPILLAELRERPADEPWPASLRHVARGALLAATGEEPEVLRLRSRLMVEVPSVRARMMESMAVTSQMFAEAVAARTGWPADSFEVRVHTRSVIGGLAELTLHWAENDFRDDPLDLLDRALDVLEHGLKPLAGRPQSP
ncbi:TetR family transcriptional regulator [Streptomyces roseirectus]|uniref:TetR family transcriptional regulator n=1 Tax=Streptomyces roseirectus TaxID=2768066 RepID=A0A7H0ICK0_9ACTN|nr:TetR family transcriptional regulator [Streptomyces roseirectus]QNP70516.1 TetR family transcriptional regulator [Streptomyces roseirectus]